MTRASQGRAPGVVLALLASLAGAAWWPGGSRAVECPSGCEDGNACTVDVCDPQAGCLHIPEPAAGCLQARRLKVSVRRSGDPSRDQWLWKWGQGEGLAPSDLGDPTGSDGYTLCVYAGTVQGLVARAALPAGSGWRSLVADGYLFSGPSPDGVTMALLKAGETARSSLLLKGKGAALPDLPLPLEPPVTLQLLRDGSPTCLEAQFRDEDIAQNTAARLVGQRRAGLPTPEGTIPADDSCNKYGADGSVAEQVGAQMRRSGTEWATTCLARSGSAGSTCEVAYPGDSLFPYTPDAVPSINCPNHGVCDYSLGRVEWHAEDKFARKCTLDQWAMVWRAIQQRAGAAAPPDCAVDAFAPRFWGVYACYEEHFVVPMLQHQLARLRAYDSPNPPMTAACEGAIATRMWWRLASDWIRHGDWFCPDGYLDPHVRDACGTGGPEAKIDQATWETWCDELGAQLRPVYEGVRAVSGKPY